MRNLLVASSAVAIGALGLYFATRGPGAAERVSAPSAPEVASGSPASRPPEPARPVFTRPVAPTATVRQPPQTMALRRKARPAAAVDRSLSPTPFADGRASRPEATAAAYRPENAAAPAKIARGEKTFPNPMDGRWVKTLSGGGARLGFARKSTDLSSCATTRNCERKPAPEQAWVAGVVVTAERLEAAPTDPLDGQLARGNYLDETPGVYVK